VIVTAHYEHMLKKILDGPKSLVNTTVYVYLQLKGIDDQPFELTGARVGSFDLSYHNFYYDFDYRQSDFKQIFDPLSDSCPAFFLLIATTSNKNF
jgi:hypothetical protein